MTKKEIKASQATWIAKTFRNLIPVAKNHIAKLEWELNEQDTNPEYKLRSKCLYSKQELKKELMETYKILQDLKDGPEPLMD